ncbi:MAG: radical SAM protein [bacterium]|nr:radical SAM protein [bacterium]
MLDRILYRLATGDWGRFRFLPGPGPENGLQTALGIYVHIPFCRRLCSFCPYTRVLYTPDAAERYREALSREAASLAIRPGLAVSSVYFGGGTPATVPAAVSRLLQLLRPCLTESPALAIELHPRDATTEGLEWLLEQGINMVSLGVESLQERALHWLGRDYGPAEALAATEAALAAGLATVNIDLITGLPGQTAEQAGRDMDRLLSLGVDQVSAYPFMEFPFTNAVSHYSLLRQWHTLNALADTAAARAYERTSVWTWTHPGKVPYTSITRQRYIGLGVGAASCLDGCFRVNTFDLAAYCDAVLSGRSPAALHTRLTAAEAALYRLFWACYEGRIDPADPAWASLPYFHRRLVAARRLGLVTPDGGGVTFTRRGFFLYHLLERYYTSRYIAGLWQAGRRAAFPGELEL